MFGKPNIEPARPEERSEAIRFVVAGESRSSLADARAQTLESMVIARRQAGISLWVARSWRKIVGAAIVMENPGKTGFLFYSPLYASGVNRDAMPPLSRAISQHAIAGGLSLVQSLIVPSAADDVDMFQTAGYELLADLVYLRADAWQEEPQESRRDLAWRCWGEFSDGELGQVISATYEGSLDCPKLSGVRKPEDVLESHRASGIFSPSSWWIVYCNNEPAGCVLMNETATADAAEITYIGVLPAHRGQGLARVMLHKAALAARQRGLMTITLAVDAGNTYARKVYDSLGFRFTDRRLAYAMLRPLTDR